MQTMDEIYHIYHRSVVQLFILAIILILIHHRLQMPTLWQDGVHLILFGLVEQGVNAKAPSFLLDNHGFPMSFHAGTP